MSTISAFYQHFKVLSLLKTYLQDCTALKIIAHFLSIYNNEYSVYKVLKGTRKYKQKIAQYTVLGTAPSTNSYSSYRCFLPGLLLLTIRLHLDGHSPVLHYPLALEFFLPVFAPMIITAMLDLVVAPSAPADRSSTLLQNEEGACDAIASRYVKLLLHVQEFSWSPRSCYRPMVHPGSFSLDYALLLSIVVEKGF